jgi:predicted GNAT family N-acyltransferase
MTGPAIRQLAFTDPDFAACFAIRLTVFVDEQKVPLEEERDEHDPTALHFLALLEGEPAGTARVLIKDAGRLAKITRVAVLASARGTGVGAALMRHIHAAVPAASFTLDAQLRALPFYERLGYRAEGPEFMEAGIPHRRMVKPGLPLGERQCFDNRPVPRK